MELLLLYHWQG